MAHELREDGSAYGHCTYFTFTLLYLLYSWKRRSRVWYVDAALVSRATPAQHTYIHVHTYIEVSTMTVASKQ